MIQIKTWGVLLGLTLLLTGCNRPVATEIHSVTDSLRQQALERLKAPLRDSLRWEKIHAAEFLLELQYADSIRSNFQREATVHDKEPYYRIGLWRVLALASPTAAERARWIRRLDAIYRDPQAPDRVHAAESMAKLGHPFKPLTPEKDPIVRLFATWAQGYEAEPAGGRARSQLLKRVEAKELPDRERKLAAYALRHLKGLQAAEWYSLGDAALNEPDDSGARIYLLSAALMHAPADSFSRKQLLYTALLAAGKGAQKNNSYELAITLGATGTQNDVPLLKRLLEGREMGILSRAEIIDVQTAAAYALLRIDRRNNPALTSPDWVVIVLYGVVMVGTGWFYSRQNKTQEDYLLGGRTMNPIAVGISLFATLLSTLSYLSYPGEMIQNGPVIFAGMFAFPFVYYAAGWWLIPRIMKMNVTSAYEILERKLGLPVRLMATFMFLSLRFLWMATIIYVTVDIALLSVVPIERDYIMPIGVLIMLITIVYTAMGGVKAVVVTDVIQAVIFLGGALVSILVVCFHFGSLTAWLPQEWPSYWQSPQLNFDVRERSTVGNAMLMLFIWYICTTGSDQMAIQRYLSTQDIQAARKSLRVSLYTNLLAKCLLGLVGLAVLAFFSRNPHYLADGTSLQQQADRLFPRFILIGLPAGLSGLVIAGLLAAAMSSLSSGLNSVSSVLSEDILQRFGITKPSQEKQLKQIQNLSYATGAVVMALSILVAGVEGNLMDVVTKVVNLFVGPLFVLFFMALFVPFATSRATLTGGFISIAMAVAIAFYGIWGITVFWILPVSLLAGISTGTFLSLIDQKLGKTIL